MRLLKIVPRNKQNKLMEMSSSKWTILSTSWIQQNPVLVFGNFEYW